MTAPLDTDVAIETPEHIVFHYRLAGPARRGARVPPRSPPLLRRRRAILRLIVFLAVLQRLDERRPRLRGEGRRGLILLALFAAQWVYFVVWEATRGRSPGKRLLGVRVARRERTPDRLARRRAPQPAARGRCAARPATSSALVSMALSSRFQRLGDLVAGTMVDRPRSARAQRLRSSSRRPRARRSSRTLPDDVSLDADEREAIELFLRRRHTLGRAREHELASMIAEPIADAPRLPPRRSVAAPRASSTTAPSTRVAPRRRRRRGSPTRDARESQRGRRDGRSLRAHREGLRRAPPQELGRARRALAQDHASRASARSTPDDVAQLAPLYRDVCADLAAARGGALQRAARRLPPRPHRRGAHRSSTVRTRAARGEDGEVRLRHAWLVAFPRAVRKRWRAMLLATGLFFIPLAIGVVLTLRDPAFAFRVAPEAMLRPLTEAYAKGFDEGRDAGEGTMMAGFYVYNNVGIALRCFALGIFGGLGSAFYLVQNGLSIGAILGYVASQGAGANIVTFIVGHGSLELGAIVLSGGAGLVARLVDRRARRAHAPRVAAADRARDPRHRRAAHR